MRVLLAEDDPSLGTKFSNLLQTAGHTVVRVNSGEEAFACFETEPFPLIVADLSFPGMNGFELCRQIRNRQKAEYVYIMILVSSGKEFDFQEAKAANVDDVFSILVEIDIFLARLRVAELMLHLYDELDTLRRLIPICAYCKKIRQEEGLWEQMEAYITGHSHALFTHTICPECMEKEFGDALPTPQGKPTRTPSQT